MAKSIRQKNRKVEKTWRKESRKLGKTSWNPSKKRWVNSRKLHQKKLKSICENLMKSWRNHRLKQRKALLNHWLRWPTTRTKNLLKTQCFWAAGRDFFLTFLSPLQCWTRIALLQWVGGAAFMPCSSSVVKWRLLIPRSTPGLFIAWGAWEVLKKNQPQRVEPAPLVSGAFSA